MSNPPGPPYPYFLPPPNNVDPAIAALYRQTQPHQSIQGMFPHPNLPTPVSDTSVESPNAAGPSQDSSKAGGKRPAKDNDQARKKAKTEHDGDDEMDTDGGSQKPKATRGSRACTVCRRLKMKCVGAENGPPCKRCETGGHECVFEESNRGKRSNKKSEALQKSLTKMEKTLDIVLRSLGNPNVQHLVESMQEDSPSPPGEASPSLVQDTANLISPSPSIGKTPDLSTGISRSESALSHRHFKSSSAVPSRAMLPPSPKLDSLPDSTLNPLGLLADTSLAHRRERESVGAAAPDQPMSIVPPDPEEATKNENTPGLGLANERYFKPGPMNILPLRRLCIERQIQPEMLTFVTKEEVVDLFKIYFEKLGHQSPVLDPAWHTPSLVCSRSPFLLTAICAAASKFYAARADLHPRLIKIAKKLAFSVPEQGFKSVEIVQAYLILAQWGIGPVERFEQDRTWLLLGLAIRVATDINLHRKLPYADEDSADGKATNQEIRNRERTWLMCFCLDRSFSTQMGKPHSVREDYIIRHASTWWRHPHAAALDIGISAYTDFQRRFSRGLDLLYSGTGTISGLQAEVDYNIVVKSAESDLSGWVEEWAFHAKDPAVRGLTDRVIEYRGIISQFYFHYANLVINSFGLQNALTRSPVDIAHFFNRCYSSAMACVKIVKENLVPKGYMQYTTDSHFVQFSYALLTLLKLIRTETKSFIEDEQAILDLVVEMADIFEDIAVNAYHTPALYSTFLRALVSSKTEHTNPGTSTPARSHHDPQTDGEPLVQTDPDYQHGDGGSPEKGSSPPPAQPYQSAYNGAFGSYNGEMGQAQVQDITTFPPTFAPQPDPNGQEYNLFSMDNILGDGFWDSVLIPGFSNEFGGLSGGYVYGAGGSGFITPKRTSPAQSGASSPLRVTNGPSAFTAPQQINAAFMQ